MNIPKNKDKTFYADINIFFSTYLPVYIHKVFNFALYQQGVHNRLIKQKYGLITYPARKIVFIC